MSLFSIIIPVYNKANYIKECLDSVLSQTEQDFEAIVVDDGSTDNSAEIINNYKNHRIKYVHKKNGGVSSARNLGIKVSKGSWICFLDADDIMYHNALQVYRSLICKYPGLGFVVASTDQSNKKYPARDKDYIVTDYDYHNAISYAKSGFSLIHTDCICISRKMFDKVGVFNEEYTHGEDLDLWKRLSESSCFAKSEIPVALYKKGTLNNSSSVSDKTRRYAPVAVSDKPRSYYKGFSTKLFQGSRIFFYVFPSLLKRWDTYKFKLLFKYLDWVLIFSLFVVYYRVKKVISK